MKRQRKVISAFLIVGIIALALAFLFNCGVVFCVNLFAANIFIGIFSGAIVAVFIAIINYSYAKFEYTRKLVLSLWYLYGHLTSCVHVNDEYKQGTFERYRSNQIRSQLVYIHGKIQERCVDVSLILQEEDMFTQAKRDEIIGMLVKIEEQFFSSRFSLECETDTEAIKGFIYAQTQTIAESGYIDNIKELLLEITQKYPRYYVNFENALIYPDQTDEPNC